MEEKRFKRTKEDFACGHCGAAVSGTGYTNHCPACLWSKHVDVNPGDRASSCEGIMQPIESELRSGTYFVKQRCLRCGHERWNALGQEDSFEALIEVERKRASQS